MRERKNTNDWVDMGPRKATTLDHDSVFAVRATFVADFEGNHTWQPYVKPKNEGKIELLHNK